MYRITRIQTHTHARIHTHPIEIRAQWRIVSCDIMSNRLASHLPFVSFFYSLLFNRHTKWFLLPSTDEWEWFNGSRNAIENSNYRRVYVCACVCMHTSTVLFRAKTSRNPFTASTCKPCVWCRTFNAMLILSLEKMCVWINESAADATKTVTIKKKTNRRPIKCHLPHATFAFGSCFKWASNTASLIWSHILSMEMKWKCYIKWSMEYHHIKYTNLSIYMMTTKRKRCVKKSRHRGARRNNCKKNYIK